MKVSWVCVVLGMIHSGHAFSHALTASYQLVCDLSQKGRIDESHNEVHSKEAFFWMNQILARRPQKLTPLEAEMTGHCVLLHDMLDRKYTDFSPDVRQHLSTLFTEEETEDMMMIMRDMSYSKIMPPHSDVPVFPEWVVSDHGRGLVNVFHIVREADLLSSYNIARMIQYRRHRFPDMSGDNIRKDIVHLFSSRMMRMIDNGLFYHDTTAELAQSLHDVAHHKMSMLHDFDTHTDNPDIFKIIDGNRLSLDSLVHEFMSLVEH